MKTIRRILIVAAMGCGVFALNARGQANEAQGASVTSGLGGDGGKIVVEAHGVAPKPALFYSAMVTEAVHVGSGIVAGGITIHFHVLQGRPEVLTLGLTGDGDVVGVSGDRIKDWGVRQGNPGERFLDIRPVLDDGRADPVDMQVTVNVQRDKAPLPGDVNIPMVTPGPAAGFSAQVDLKPGPAAEFSVTDATGMLPYGTETGVRGEQQFYTTGNGKLTVHIERLGGAAPDAELVGTALSGTLNEAAQCVDFRLTGQARITGTGTRIALLSGNAALSGVVAVDGWHVELVRNGGGYSYEMVFDKPGTYPVDVAFSAPLLKNGDWRGVDFQMPAGVVVPVALAGVPEKATFDPGQPVVPGWTPQGWRGFLPADGRGTVSWKPEQQTGEGTLFFTGSEETDVKVGAGLLRQTSKVTLKILQGKMPGVRLDLNGPGEILSVEGDNVVGWSVTGDKQRTLDVRLSRPIEKEETLTVRSQAALGSFPVHAEALRLTPEGAVRLSGFVRVTNDGAVRIEVADATGMMQLEPSQFPGDAPSDGVRQVFVYRFASADYSYRIVADQIVPEVNVSQVATYEIAETDRVINADIELDIREAPIREWSMGIPADYSVVAVTGNDVADYAPENEASGATRNLKVIFSGAVDGRELLHVRLEKNQTAGAGDWQLPPLTYPGAKSVRGQIGVVSMPGYRVAAKSVDKLVEVPLSYFQNQVSGLQQAYRLREGGWSATMKVDALGQSVQADVFHLYSLKEGMVYGSVLINYFVIGAPASEWRISVPKSAGNIDVVGQNVRREWRREGDQIIVSLHEPVLGPATLLVTFEQPMSARGGTIDPGEVQPLGVQSERGYVQVVSPLEVKYQVSKADGGLLKLDPSELPAEFRLLTSAPSLVIYQYTARPFALEMNIEWYAPADTADQLVDFAKLTSQISRDGQAVTDAQYFVKTRGRKALRMVLPDGMKLWEARVDNEIVNARADGDQTIIPLPPRTNPNEPVKVTLRLGQMAVHASRPDLTAPKMLAPTVIGEWTLTSDTGRLLVPKGGTAELKSANLTESGFGWLTGGRRVDVVMLLGMILAASALMRRPQTWLRVVGLLLCMVAMATAFLTADDAYFGRRMNENTLAYAASVIPAGETVTIHVANVAPWVAMISWWGVIEALLGGAMIAFALMVTMLGGERRAGLLAVGTVLLSLGLLAQRGGAAWFFLAAGVGVFVVLFIPALRSWMGTWMPAPKRGGAAPGAAVASLLIVSAMLLAAAPGAHAARGPMVVAQNGMREADSIVETWKIEKDRLHGEIDVQVRGVTGDSYALLVPPAVLTGFQGDGLHVTKIERGGRTVYYMGQDKDGVLTAHASFEMPVKNLGNGIPVPTEAAAVDRVTIQLDQAGWEFSSDAAVSVTPLQGLAAGQSGATLVLGPAGSTSIKLSPKRRDAATEVTQFFTEIANIYIAGPGFVNGSHYVTVRPAQGRVSALEFTVPKGFTVGEVHDGPVGAWRFDPGTRKLSVAIEPAQTDAFRLTIETQLGTAGLPVALTLEPMKITGASGGVGTVALAFGNDAQPEGVKPNGLSPGNLDDFDAGLISKDRNGQPLATLMQVFRYSGDGGSVSLKVAPVAPEVRVTTSQTLSLGDDRLVLAVDLNVAITRAGIFKLSFPLPDGLEVESLTGSALSQWTEDDENGKRIITLHLTGKTMGEQTFSLTLSGAAPHAQAAWEVPKVIIREATRQSGQILLVPEQGIRFVAGERKNASPMPLQATGEMRPSALQFRLLEQDYTLKVGIEALDPWVAVQGLQEVTMREGQTLTRLALRYKVDNASVKALQVRLPGLSDAQGQTVRVTGSAVSDIVNVGGDVWEVRFQHGIIGETDAQIEYQGQSARTDGNEEVRNAQFVHTQQVTLYAAVRSSGRIEVEAGDVPRGWEREDWGGVPATLQDRADRSVPALCFRVAEPEGPLTVAVRRHELADELKVRITEGTLTTIFSPRGPSMTAVELKAEVVEKTAMRVRLPDGAQLIDTFVNGESMPVVREDAAYLFNVSPGTAGESGATIRMVYSVPAAQSGGIALLGPVFNVPMENVTWHVMAPAGYEVARYSGDLTLKEKESAGQFGMADYTALVSSLSMARSRSATALMERANTLMQKGDQQQAGEAFDRAANSSGLDAATNEDARVQLRVLKTQQAVLGLNTRLQKLYLDNRADTERNGALEEAANMNPFLQGKSNYDPQQYDQLLQGNTIEENNALSGIASRLVDQQLAAEPAPSAIDVTMPVNGQELTFTRSMQVDGNTPLSLDLRLRTLPRSNWGFVMLLMLGTGVVAGIVAPRGRRG